MYSVPVWIDASKVLEPYTPSDDGQLKSDIIKWFGNGNVGNSSTAMALCIAGVRGPKAHPLDTGDLQRCIDFLEQVPGARAHMGKLRDLSPVWAILVQHWDLLNVLLKNDKLKQQPLGGSPLTYHVMKALGC